MIQKEVYLLQNCKDDSICYQVYDAITKELLFETFHEDSAYSFMEENNYVLMY